MENIFGRKIKSARLIKGLGQEELAQTIGITKQMVSKYEKGLSMPSSAHLFQLADALQVNVDFFFSAPQLELGTVNFRKKSAFGIRKQESLKEKLQAEIADYIEIEDLLQVSYSGIVEACSVEVRSIAEVEQAVVDIRHQWDIGLDPIHNIIQLLEDHEIKVIEIDETADAFDGLACLVNDNIPVIVVNKNFPVERKRFTLAHELGHLLLKIPDSEQSNIEKYCNRFAGAFLFQQSAIIKEFGVQRSPISLAELIEVQKKYGMSIQGIMYRLKDIGIISEARHAGFYRKINANPSLKQEVDLERFASPEYSHRFEQLVYRAMSQDLISASKAAVLLKLPLEQVLESAVL
jgi:Zn-dependent peptidase ImmA (M78 family)/DNA-binding XRE family transcriptional regulator